ncbi:AfsR/SARP family transcriptional regulator [Nonomuraea sp. SYSU D8015]|uniref:AfsR/SARP family transcriptional regulator n=1 Tax=Nonomuraea sp. SYSU D8015 TaxID=2593644 RepID=UPI0016610AEE|nr:BTAD domain-containing putative transcriptional regulator [Nonomuraea sp. SYSU D8015]
MDLRLLGLPTLEVGSRVFRLGTPKQLVVVASLALSPGRPLPVETLIFRLWSDAPPGEARAGIRTYVARLRQTLRQAGEEIELSRAGGGHVLQLPDQAVDLHRFRALAGRARTAVEAGEDEAAVKLLEEALALWRGEPLAGIPGGWAGRVREGLAREYLVARVVYRDVRTQLAEELGVEPGAELRRVHQMILTDEGTPDTTAPSRPTYRVTPRQLPPDVTDFVGRDAEIAQLDELRCPGSSGQVPN